MHLMETYELPIAKEVNRIFGGSYTVVIKHRKFT